EVGLVSSRKSFARVVLPEPDSPTMPSVSPSATCTLTPSTALIRPRACPTNQPVLTGKYFVSPIPCSSIDASRPHFCGSPAVRHVPGCYGYGGWTRLLQEGGRRRARWRKGAAGG